MLVILSFLGGKLQHQLPDTSTAADFLFFLEEEQGAGAEGLGFWLVVSHWSIIPAIIYFYFPLARTRRSTKGLAKMGTESKGEGRPCLGCCTSHWSIFPAAAFLFIFPCAGARGEGEQSKAMKSEERGEEQGEEGLALAS